MELDGMNKISQEKRCAVLSPNTSCQKHLFNVLPCEVVPEATERISLLSSAAQAVSINCSYSNEPRDVSVLKASLRTQMENHLNSFSPAPENDTAFVAFPHTLAGETLAVPEMVSSNQPNPFKCPCDHDENQASFDLKEANSAALICASPSSSSSVFFASDSIFVNGSTSTSLVCSTESATPCDTSLDINGHSGSHTPASPNDSDKTRMDLSKLDETIDYVLSNARSDNPCEGMFVLTCRNRELTHLSSPNFRANTPSSGHLVSPSPPPTPSSPHSHHVTSSPLIHSTNRPHAFLQSCASNVNVTHPMQRYVVDRGTGLVQFSPFSMNSQCIPSQRSTQQPVSFVHLYSDPGPLRVQVSERTAYSSTGPPTPMVLHQNVQRTVQNHMINPAQTTTVSHITGHPNGSTMSPSKINLVQAVTTQVSKLATVSQFNTTFYQPFAASVASSTHSSLLSPSASVCCVVQNSNPSVGLNTGAVALGFHNDMNSAISSSLLPVSRHTHVQSPGSVSFRQPNVPTQLPIPPCISSQNSVSPLVPDQIIPAVTPISSPSQPPRVTTAAVLTGPSRKRGNSSLTAGSKRRRTSTLSPTSANLVASSNKTLTESNFPAKSNQLFVQECFERLKLIDSKSLVSAPILRPYGTVLPPVGASDSVLVSLGQKEESSMLKRKGLKYHRGMMSLHVPRCFVSGNLFENVDCYITRHLQPNTPIGPMVHESPPCSNGRAATNKRIICPSPEPVTFENHMMTFFSSIQQSPDGGTTAKMYAGHSSLGTAPTSSVLLTPKLLPIFTDASSGADKPDPERCTPPLPLLHIPNPKLISESSVFGIDERSNVSSCDLACRSPVTGFSASNYFHHVTPPFFNSISGVDIGTSEDSPVVDSETGEVMGRHHPTSVSHTNDTLEKLNITFTVDSSVSHNIPKIITRISELLGVDQDSVCYQITRSGAQITLDQKHSQVEGLICHLESQLREQFTPLSLHFYTSVDRTLLPPQPPLRLISPHPESLESMASPLPKFHTDSSACRLDASGPPITESTTYSEEPISIVSLLSSKHVIAKPCQFCDKMVAPGKGLRKNLEDVASLTGLTPQPDAPGEIAFCSDDCISRFSRFVLSRRSSCPEPSGLYSTEATPASIEARSRSLAFDLASNIPVLLQGGPSKTAKSMKRHHACSSLAAGSGRRRGGLLGHCYSKHKRWKGVRWRVFSHESPPTIHSDLGTNLPTDKLLSVIRHDRSVLRLPSVDDPRACALCWIKGDASESSLGRLLPLDVDQWLHINCALWCYEVYETIGGSLNNVTDWLMKAKDTSCSHCGRFGAGLPCYNPRCTFIYHVPCALSIGCMFFTDRGMYCPQHQPREAHPMQLTSLTVNRRVYIARDENAQIGSVIHEEDRTSVIRIGTLSLHNVGQLLPHQLESGYFHNRRYIYPVGFRSTRIYWSMRVPRKRARYICEIVEANGRPLFRVTASDRDLPDESVENETCADVWKSILTKVEQIRNGSKFLRLFCQHLKGEDMYGLSEPHVVRAIESLPGVDSLRDYVFNFGRMELIAEMPLAINPSGCARSEPKMQTYVKRSTPYPLNGIVSPVSRPLLPGLRRPTYPCLSLSNTNEFSKQYQSSRSQQYRRLKGEASSNVILGRSRIQGLGLFAARELEPQTMVIEYIGELIRIELSNKREKEYEAQHRGIYMFRLDHDTVIDATMCGGLARYVNHSCQPNCFAEYLNFGDRSHIVIITNRRIEKGEELCYDYNFDLEDGGSKIPCLCRSVNCRKWMN